jgi:hypothetical protein
VPSGGEVAGQSSTGGYSGDLTASSAAPPAATDVGQASIVQGGGAPGQPGSISAETTSQGGMDAGVVWLAGFGILLAIGLAITLVPLRPRRRRGSHS